MALSRLSGWVSSLIPTFKLEVNSSFYKQVGIFAVLSTAFGMTCQEIFKSREAKKKMNHAAIKGDEVILPKKDFKTDIPDSKFQYYGDIVLKASKDLGFKGPTIVTFTERYPGENTANCLGFISNWQRAVIVNVTPTFVKTEDDKTMYALAGHEMAHTVREHHRLSASTLMLRLLSTGYIFGHVNLMVKNPLIWLGTSYYFQGYFFGMPLSRRVELDADSFSAKKLGTADDLIAWCKSKQHKFGGLSESENRSYYEFDSNFSTHPSWYKRIENLNVIKNQKGYPTQSLFFSHYPARKLAANDEKDLVTSKTITK